VCVITNKGSPRRFYAVGDFFLAFYGDAVCRIVITPRYGTGEDKILLFKVFKMKKVIANIFQMSYYTRDF